MLHLEIKMSDYVQSSCQQFDPLELVSKKPHTVVLMLDSPEEHVLQSACEALYKFSEKCKFNQSAK